MKNKLSDLNNYLFESLERINDDSLTDKQLEKELAKANTTATIALAIVKNADTTLKGAKFLKESGVSDRTLLIQKKICKNYLTMSSG